MNRFTATLLFVTALSACSSNIAQAPVPQSTAAPAPNVLYAYSPSERPLVATYAANTSGEASPTSILAGSKTDFAIGKQGTFSGGIIVGNDGSLYVLDGMRAKVLVFAPGASGNSAPIAIEKLPPTPGASYGPQYAGFAADTLGNFWTVDRSTGNLLRFPLGKSGRVKPSFTLKPQVEEYKLVPGVASTVASDGQGDIYCVCQPNDLALQLYCITEYRVAAAGEPKLVRSFYGILGNLDTQIPSSVLHVDARTKTVYVGIWTPDAIVEYPADAPTGQAPAPRVIGGPRTTIDAPPEAIATDSSGAVYVALGSSIAVFRANAAGNVAPARTITDQRHLHFLGRSFGEFLAIP